MPKQLVTARCATIIVAAAAVAASKFCLTWNMPVLPSVERIDHNVQQAALQHSDLSKQRTNSVTAQFFT
jgi:hypothetical protein